MNAIVENFDNETKAILSKDNMNIANINEIVSKLNFKALCKEAKERHAEIQIETDKSSAEPKLNQDSYDFI